MMGKYWNNGEIQTASQRIQNIWFEFDFPVMPVKNLN